jgi:hypothetical protein
MATFAAMVCCPSSTGAIFCGLGGFNRRFLIASAGVCDNGHR